MNRHLRSKAANCLLYNWITEFPISAKSMRLHNKNISYLPYCNSLDIFEDLDLVEYSKTHSAFIIEWETDDYCIYYDDKMSAAESEFVFGHEKGHAAIGHTVVGVVNGKAILPHHNEGQEKEADYYSLYCIGAPCILYKMGVSSAREISKITGLSIERASIIFAQIKEMTDYDLSSEEVKLCEMFSSYITQYRSRRRKTRYKKLISKVAVAALCVAVLAVGYYFIISTSTDTALPSIMQSNNSVYVTSNGKKFHSPECRYTSESATKLTIAEAIKQGYGACKICEPLDE